ncbi:FAD-binding protein [Isoptericola sp. NPDC019482]|uniref:FAD-binding oxidoreductase n=1 Tax=Isoptericola sp. NPDC019482 TaxID=3154688 RepID=UPI0034953B15
MVQKIPVVDGDRGPTRAPDREQRVVALEERLVELLGAGAVSAEPRVRQRASVDGAIMSPILAARLPLPLADLVAFPEDAVSLARAVAAAVRLRVPVTVRGKGTGNYGQALPLRQGLVLDTTRARAITEVGDGFLTAEAGTPMVLMERAAWAAGQQLQMYPSTVHSTIAGFLGGGKGGTGSVAHGFNDRGFVRALDVVHADGSDEIVHVTAPETLPYVHTYGTTGVIVRATVALEPLQQWRAVYASFPDLPSAAAVLRPLCDVEPAPRLVSCDNPAVSAAFPEDTAMPAGRASLRVVVDAATLDGVVALVEGGGGRIEDVREGLNAVLHASTLSYNHAVEWVQKRSTVPLFHVEVGGPALPEKCAAVESVYPGGMLHLEGTRSRPNGLLVAPFRSERDVREGYESLAALGIGHHDAHQWMVDTRVDEAIATAARTDPQGLLNPGRLPVETRPGGRGAAGRG